MADAVEVVGIEIAREWLAPPSPKDGSRQPWVELAVRVRNDTAEPQYVIGEIRGIEFDDATRTLRLRLRDRAATTRGPGEPILRLTEPKLERVPPGGEIELRIDTPAIQQRMVPGPGLGLATSPFDLRDVVSVDVELAHAAERRALVPGARAPAVASTAKLRMERRDPGRGREEDPVKSE